MALRDAIEAVCTSWDDVVTRLGEDQKAVKVLLRRLVDEPNDTQTMLTIVRLLAEVLPTDHPVLLALSLEDDRSPDAARRWTQTVAELVRLLGD